MSIWTIWLASFSHSFPITNLSTSTSTRTATRSHHGGQVLLFGKKNYNKRTEAQYEEILPDGSDAWRLSSIITSTLSNANQGGVGVLPTESGYVFVTPLESKAGLERILRIKGFLGCKKPLSVLCPNLSAIETYCYGIDKRMFKLLKSHLPGPYTFVLPATTALPKMMFLDSKGGKHAWARKTLGVRIPSDPVLRYVQDELLDGMPLLVSSLPSGNDDDEEYDDDDEIDIYARQQAQLQTCDIDVGASWCTQVDFIINAGARPMDGSTIYDLTGGEATLIREGLGDLSLA